jgi:hypothetical protein
MRGRSDRRHSHTRVIPQSRNISHLLKPVAYGIIGYKCLVAIVAVRSPLVYAALEREFVHISLAACCLFVLTSHQWHSARA